MEEEETTMASAKMEQEQLLSDDDAFALSFRVRRRLLLCRRAKHWKHCAKCELLLGSRK